MINRQNIIDKINLLVIDDMEAVRSVVSSCAKELGINNVFSAANGEAAWKQILNANIDLIICDWDMPVLSGIELLKRVRGSTDTNHIPFIMLTATTSGEQVKMAIENGVTDYLSKPFQPKQLEYRIIKVLRKVSIKE